MIAKIKPLAGHAFGVAVGVGVAFAIFLWLRSYGIDIIASAGTAIMATIGGGRTLGDGAQLLTNYLTRSQEKAQPEVAETPPRHAYRSLRRRHRR